MIEDLQMNHLLYGLHNLRDCNFEWNNKLVFPTWILVHNNKSQNRFIVKILKDCERQDNSKLLKPEVTTVQENHLSYLLFNI